MKPFSKTIAVYGSSAITQESEAARQAERLGRILAESSFAICNGGYMGVMEACSRGAREAGGQIIGVTTSTFSKRKPNPYLTKEIPAGDLLERITTLMRLADAYIVLDGSIGTLAELFLAWNLVATGWNKPLIVVGEENRSALQALKNHTEIQDKHLSLLTFAPTVDEAAEHLKNFY